MLKEIGFEKPQPEFKVGDLVQHDDDKRLYSFDSYDADPRWCWCTDGDGNEYEFEVKYVRRAR